MVVMMMMRNKSFGTISKVFFNKIVIEVPDPSNIHQNYKGDFYTLDGLNDYITIYKDYHNKYVYQITGLYEQEKALSPTEDSKFEQKAYFDAVPIGEIYYGEFEYGLSTFPIIGEEVYLITVKDIQNVLMPDKNILPISFGKLTTHDYIPQLSVDSLFTNHMAILGNTGSGKSTTMRKILNELLNLHIRGIDPNKMNFIIFDLHNEYTIFANEYLTPVNLDEISIPLDTLNLEDWINLVQPAMSVQLPVLMNGLKMASILESDSDRYDWIKAYCALELYNNQQTDAVTKRTKIVNLLDEIPSDDIKKQLKNYDSQFGNFRTEEQEGKFKMAIYSYIKYIHNIEYYECEEELREVLDSSNEGFENLLKLKDGVDTVLLLEESKGNIQARTHCQTLMTRIDNIILNYSSNLFSNNRDRINKFYEIIKYEKALTVFDCSNLEDSDLLFLSGYFSREIL